MPLPCAASAALFVVLLVAALPAAASDASENRCETRVEPRAIYGRNYVLDRVTVCRHVEPPSAEAPVRRERPAPPSNFGAPIAAELGNVGWDAARTTLGNAQYDRSVRALRRAFVRREG